MSGQLQKHILYGQTILLEGIREKYTKIKKEQNY